MPVTYRIDTTKRIIVTTCVGNVTFSEVSDHFQALKRDPECPDRLNVLLDFSEMTSVPEAEQLRAVSSQIGGIQEKVQFGNCAIVACTNVLFGMARMLEVFAEEWFREVLVFRAREEAEAWLTSRSGL